jgi:peptidoglycan/LPS O-acetylase OafA/YrhL
VIFHYRDQLSALRLPVSGWWLLLTLFSVFPLLADMVGAGRHYLGYYGAAILFLPIFISSVCAKPTSFDTWLGDLAYPIFLLHFFALGLVRLVVPIHLSPLSTAEAVLVYATTFLIACAVERWFDPSLNGLRDMVRPPARHLGNSQGAPLDGL